MHYCAIGAGVLLRNPMKQSYSHPIAIIFDIDPKNFDNSKITGNSIVSSLKF